MLQEEDGTEIGIRFVGSGFLYSNNLKEVSSWLPSNWLITDLSVDYNFSSHPYKYELKIKIKATDNRYDLMILGLKKQRLDDIIKEIENYTGYKMIENTIKSTDNHITTFSTDHNGMQFGSMS